jgi:hypothetical protein
MTIEKPENEIAALLGRRNISFHTWWMRLSIIYTLELSLSKGNRSFTADSLKTL